MKYHQDPPRLAEAVDEAPEQLRLLLQQAREDLPTETQLHRLALALAPYWATPAAGASTTALGASGAKAVGVLLIGGAALGGGAWVALSGAPAPAEDPARAPAVRPASQAGPQVRSSADLAQPPTSPSRAVELGSEPGEPSSQAPAVLRSAPKAPVIPPRSGSARTTTPSAPSEAQLLQAAQALLRNDPRRALALAREHERRFPNGALAQEREVITIEALGRLGRERDARARADEFRSRYPDSAHRRRVGNAVPSK